MMAEAYPKIHVGENPCKKVMRLAKNQQESGTIPLSTMGKLFDSTDIPAKWGANLFHFTFNLLAASSGMRQAEILGLQIGYVFPDYVGVEFTWDRKYGQKEPKYGSKKVIPIPALPSSLLQKMIDNHPTPNDPDSLLFFGKSLYSAMDRKAINKHFYRALERVGVSPEQRKEQNITIHSLRHTFNSLMRNRIPDSKPRKLTGHKSEEMTDHYTHFQIEDFHDVAAIQNEIFT
jgi:integrase